MATKVQIWNRAARAAGETQRIGSEDPSAGVVPATLADIHDDKLREILSVREWPWAVAQAALTEVGEQAQPYTGDGVTVDFVVPYDIGDASQLTVTAGGITKTLGTDYTFTPPDNGFNARVTFVAAPAAASAIVLTVTTARVGWGHAYALPDDCLRPLALLHEGERRGDMPQHCRTPFAVVPNNTRTGYLLCTDDDSFEVLEYVALITEPTAYPPHFVEAFVRLLAAHLLDAVKKSPGEAQAMLQLYELALSDAVMVGNSSAGHMAPPVAPALIARGAGNPERQWGRR